MRGGGRHKVKHKMARNEHRPVESTFRIELTFTYNNNNINNATGNNNNNNNRTDTLSNGRLMSRSRVLTKYTKK